MRWFILFLAIGFSSCNNQKEKIEKPFYINFKLKKDSVYVSVNNPLACPTFILFKNNSKDSIINLKPFENKIIFKVKDSLLDTLHILKKYKPSLKYGSYPLKEYDTFYNYSLPFLKGKRYKIIQGHFGKFSHSSQKSRYAIDFRMNIGQEVCAMRDGIVVKIKQDSNKGGKDKKYYNDANYILLYHKDGTFSQYIHLKYNGVLVKKGDTVKKNQTIALSGNTGYSTAPHLHFGIFKPTLNGFISIPYILDSIPSKNYIKGKYAIHN